MLPAPLSPTPEFLALQQAVAGRYALVRELGRGGMGVVFLARDVALERLVAIKLLPPALSGDAGARTRFVREAQTVAALSHPHIVPIHLVEARGGLVFFVMAYVDGETLGERVRRGGALSTAEAMRIVQEVAWALGHAHAHGVVHRDVKPDNILLDGATGRAMVTDFGIAFAPSHEAPGDETVRGTPQYMSPEVMQGSGGDAASDLYSLGVTAWVAAAGRLPFDASSVAAQLLAHMYSDPPSLAIAASVPTRFALAVDRCLRKSAADRWPSADAFAAEIDATRARVPRVAAPVRAFLREWDETGGEFATAGTASLVALIESVSLHLIGGGTGESFDIAVLKWVFAIIAVVTAGLAKARGVQLLAHARSVLRAGYGHARLASAALAESAERADERSAAASVVSGQRRDTAWVLAGSVLGTVGAFALAFAEVNTWIAALGAAGAVALPAVAIRTLWRSLTRDAVEPLSSRLLRGRLGRFVLRAAGLGMSVPSPVAALEGPEPTEIALGQAARALHEALPPDLRAGLDPGLPALIDALETRALQARARGDLPVDDRERTVAIAALETLRLDLLRLSVRAITPAELTAELERVRELGGAIDRHLAARDEVADLVARSRTPAAPSLVKGAARVEATRE